MAYYTYHCNVCNYSLDVTHPITVSIEHHCPMCQTLMTRIIYAPAFDLRGGGWTPKHY